jgi:hypothetical protein
MATSDADLWHQVHAQREDGVAAMFLIREVDPRADQPQIFVIEMPYPITDLSKLPDAAGYSRLDTFQEQWIEPACEALGWTFVAWKSEDGSFFLYLYGDGDPNALLERLAPFDGALGFFNDRDTDWSEYAALRELVEQAQSADDDDDDDEADDNGGHVHTEACEHDADATSQSISVVDLTGERPAGKAKSSKAKSGKATSETAKPKAMRPKAMKPKATKPKATKRRPAKPSARAAKAAPAKSAAKKAPAKPAAKKAPAKSAVKKPPAKPAPAKPKAKATTKRAVARPSAAMKTANRAGARKPASSKPAARKPARPKR